MPKIKGWIKGWKMIKYMLIKATGILLQEHGRGHD